MSAPLLNVAQEIPRTESEGPGIRYAIWVQGCPLRCPGCCNPELLAFTPAQIRSPEAIVAGAIASGSEGVSLLGGEPFAQAAGLAAVAWGVRRAGLSVMVFTGYRLEALRRLPSLAIAELLAATDLLVDGPYRRELRSLAQRWIGSSNQRLHFLSDRYQPGDPRLSGRNTVELRLEAGTLTLNGWPTGGAE